MVYADVEVLDPGEEYDAASAAITAKYAGFGMESNAMGGKKVPDATKEHYARPLRGAAPDPHRAAGDVGQLPVAAHVRRATALQDPAAKASRGRSRPAAQLRERARMGTVWAFDVDGCLVDSITGTSLRPLARPVLEQLRAQGSTVVLWSAGGGEYPDGRPSWSGSTT